MKRTAFDTVDGFDLDACKCGYRATYCAHYRPDRLRRFASRLLVVLALMLLCAPLAAQSARPVADTTKLGTLRIVENPEGWGGFRIERYTVLDHPPYGRGWERVEDRSTYRSAKERVDELVRDAVREIERRKAPRGVERYRVEVPNAYEVEP